MLRTTALHMLSTRWRSASKATECELRGLERRLIGRNRSFSYRLVTLYSTFCWVNDKVYPLNAQKLYLSIFVFERSFQIRIRICYFYLPSIYLSSVSCVFFCARVSFSLSLSVGIFVCMWVTLKPSAKIYITSQKWQMLWTK